MPIAVIYITSGMLFLGAAPLPYGYYMLLRIVATAAFVWAAIVAHEKKYSILPWIFCVCAILFNPIMKIHLPKEFWIAIDIGTGILLLTVQSKIRESADENI